jgi:hypothetical protein
MLTMRRAGDRNLVAQPFEHGLQLNESMGCSNVQRCERADHLQSAMASYSHSVSFIHQQRDGLEFGSKGHRFALPCVEMCQAESTGCFRLTTSNHRGGCEIHARTIARVFE